MLQSLKTLVSTRTSGNSPVGFQLALLSSERNAKLAF
jgi:hypothetical protein